MENAMVSGRGAARWWSRQHPWIYRGDVLPELPQQRQRAEEGAETAAPAGGAS